MTYSVNREAGIWTQFVQALVLLFSITVLPFCPVVPQTTPQALMVPAPQRQPHGGGVALSSSRLQGAPPLTVMAHSLSPKVFRGISIIISHFSFLPPGYGQLRNRMLEPGRWCASWDNAVNVRSPLGSRECIAHISPAHCGWAWPRGWPGLVECLQM